MTHSSQQNNHILENWTYANAAARTGATGFASADLGKVAYQTDTGQYWRLTAVTPTWALVGPQSTIDLQVFSASGTWTKPANAKSTFVICIGAGAGGGSGRRNVVGVLRSGGTGGNAGTWWELRIPSASLGATETVTVGIGGGGGAAQTVDSTNGVAGTQGGDSSFGSWLTAKGGSGGGGGVSGGSVSGPSLRASMRPQAGAGAGNTSGVGGQGNTGFQSPGANVFFSGSGAGGSGLSAADVPSAGGLGGASFGPTAANSGGNGGTNAGTNPANNGANGIDNPNWGSATLPIYMGSGGGGGGGGNGAGTVVGGTGGNGGRPGGGGGGGGASTNGANSGAGGNGGDGYVWVLTECFG